MIKLPSAPNYFYGVFLVVFKHLFSSGGFHKSETRFLAVFLLFTGFPLFIQMNKLNIPYNFIQ
jgi:hypothetical protein